MPRYPSSAQQEPAPRHERVADPRFARITDNVIVGAFTTSLGGIDQNTTTTWTDGGGSAQMRSSFARTATLVP